MHRNDLIQTLEAALPSGRVVSDDATYAPYSKDYSSVTPVIPTVVVKPKNHKEVGIVLAIANQTNTPVTPRGTGTGKSGGSIPVQKGIVMSMEAFDNIIEIDTANRMAVVEPGAICQHINNAAQKEGLMFPVEPSSAHMCTIGGMVAENAGGLKAIKYGVTGNYVVGLSGFYASGEPFEWGGKLVKNVAGYDLISLIVGSEGTLVVITKIILKLVPNPKHDIVVWASFDNLITAAKTLEKFHQTGITPAAAELMDKACIKAYETAHNVQVDASDKEGHVLFQLDGNHKRILEEEANQIKKYVESNGATSVKIATEKSEKELMITIRMGISEALTAVCTHKESVDITVPTAKMADYMTYLTKLNTETEYTILGYGHLGDGNFHVNILNTTQPEDVWLNDLKKIEEDLIKKALSMGGTLTGEHGIGLSKKQYMPLQFSSKDSQVFQKIKYVFDPNNGLNPETLI